MSTELPPEWPFDRFTLHAARREVLHQGRPLSMGSRAFEVLLALAERRDRVVGKHELMDLVWPGIYVHENNLQVHVSALRKLLGPRVITTVPGRGYRFTAGATPSVGAASADDASLDAIDAQACLPLEFSLPADPRAELLGRRTELAGLLGMLRRYRLVTVLGAGGIGKTTLALAAAHAQAAGGQSAAWVELTPLSDPALIPGAIAAALSAPLLAGGDAVAALAQSLSESKVLLVLDNGEHQLPAVAAVVQALLAGCPELRVMVTSQAPLKLDAERQFRLGPLAVPRGGALAADTARSHGATALFERQVQALDRSFSLTDHNACLVAEICRRLDGIAMAINLAAAHVPTLGLQELCGRLDARFALLGDANRQVSGRQKTLRAALDWSHGLLSAQEQAVFRRLSVCVGGFTLDLAGGVATDEALDKLSVIEGMAQLVDRSLVALDEGSRPRYRMLESARAYAQQALADTGELALTQARHAQAMLALMREAHEAYIAVPEPAWMKTYFPELDNLRAALAWACVHDTETAIALLGAAARFYQLVGLFHEALPLTDRVLAHLSEATPPTVAWGFWVLRANALLPVSRPAATACHERYVSSARASGDAPALFLALCAGIGLGYAAGARMQADLAEMRTMLRPGWPVYLHTGLWLAEAMQSYHSGDLAQARALMERMATGNRAVGKMRFASHGLSILVGWDVEAGQFETAVQHAKEAVAMQRQFGAWNLMLGLRGLVQAQLLSSRWREAEPAMRELAELIRRLGWRGLQFAADGWALHAARMERWEDAARLMGFADALFVASGVDRDRLQGRVRDLAEVLLLGAKTLPELQGLKADGAALTPELAAATLQADSAA